MDPVLEDPRTCAAADDATVGVLLIGSRATGSHEVDSDYDLIWILTDEGMESRMARGDPQQVKRGAVDVNYMGIGRLRERVDDLDWATRALIASQIVVDPAGEIELLEDMRKIVTTGDPSTQQDLETRVENFMTARGIAHDWEDALDKLRAWRF